jgi:hypothetical protein
VSKEIYYRVGNLDLQREKAKGIMGKEWIGWKWVYAAR